MAGTMEAEREEWKQTALGWKKWEPFLMLWLNPVGERMLEMVKLKDGDVVLDVATGSGEPGLSAARIVGRGKVIGLDISQEMVEIARAKAENLGVENYEARVYSSSEFPFGSNQFDVALSRFGVMFFPDVLEGLKEMTRVLKQGGHLCVSVWAPQNEAIRSAMRILTEELRLPEPAPDAPSPFRCSETGKITLLMRQAGLRDVEQVEVTTQRAFGSVGQYWEYLLDMNYKIASAFNDANEEMKARAKLRVNESLDPMKGESGDLKIDSVAWISHGMK